jgi:hypothetical protein
MLNVSRTGQQSKRKEEKEISQHVPVDRKLYRTFGGKVMVTIVKRQNAYENTLSFERGGKGWRPLLRYQLSLAVRHATNLVIFNRTFGLHG